MFRSLMTRTLAVALGLVGVLGITGNAPAAYEVRLTMPDVGPTVFTLPDNGIVGPIKDNNAGPTGINGNGNDFIDLTNGIGNPFVFTYGSGRTLTFTQIATNSLAPAANSLTRQFNVIYNANGQGASGALTIEYSRNGYTAPLPGLNVLTSNVSGTFAAGSTGSVTLTQGYGGTNLLYTNTVPVLHGTFATPNSYSSNISQNIISVTPYSFTSTVVLNFAGSGQFLGDGTISLAPPSGVPVPAGLVLALTGLPALGLFSRLRRRNAQV